MPYSHSRNAALALAFVLATFSGRIIDATTGQPIGGLRVELQGPTARVLRTDAHGNVHATNLRPGDYTVRVESADVPPQSFDLAVKAHGTNSAVMKVCSTTLDYHCEPQSSGGGGG